MTLKKSLHMVVLAALSVAAGALLFYANHVQGMGVSHDSMFYIAMAKHVAAGKGVYAFMKDASPDSVPITRYSPFFSVVLAGFFKTGLSIRDSVLWFNVLFLSANVAVIGALVLRFTRNLFWASLAAVVFATEPLWLDYHSWILTEPLFIFTTNLSILFLAIYLDKNRLSDLSISAFFAALAGVTRYTGIAYPAVGAVALCLFAQDRWFRRLARASIYWVASFLPLLGWLIRNIIRSYRPGATLGEMAFGDLGVPRKEYASTPLSYLFQSADLLIKWLKRWTGLTLPVEPLWILVAGGLVVIGIVFLLWRKPQWNARPRWASACLLLALYAFGNLFFLIAYLHLSGQGIPMDIRYLMMILMPFLLAALFLIYGLLESLKGWTRKTAMVLGLIVFLGWSSFTFTRIKGWTEETRRLGADRHPGFSWFFVNSRQWLPDQT